MNKWKIKAISSVVLIFMSLSFYFLLDALISRVNHSSDNLVHASDNIVAFNLKGTVQAFVQQSSHLHLNSQQQSSLSQRFDRVLDEVVKAYAKTHHAVILVKQGVIAGAPDITAFIRSDIAKHMRREGYHE